MTVSVVYGPVPSRRLGRSMGVNNIPPKICSYSCIYCQLGRTLKLEVQPRLFYAVEAIVDQVRAKLLQAREKGESVDYVTFVPDGETTLDASLGRELDAVKAMGVTVAVISNGSLLWRSDVRKNLLKADWLSLKIDSVVEKTWHRIDRPHGSLNIGDILEGILDFASIYKGQLTTETMLVSSVNDDPAEIKGMAEFIVRLKPSVSYLAIPVRPPCENIEPPREHVINQAYQIFKEELNNVEYLIGYEGNSFASTGKAREDLLSITSVHPMRKDAVMQFLLDTGNGWDIVRNMLDCDELIETEYRGDKFYMRRLPGHNTI